MHRSVPPARLFALSRRMGRACLVGGLVLWGLGGQAMAQLSPEDIAALRERGKAEGWTFTVGENGATRYSLDQLCGTIEPADRPERISPDAPDSSGFTCRGDPLPVAFDWRDYGGCTPIRNQGGCGSCWAFSAVGAVECAMLINDGVGVDLSEQWLVSCTTAGSCGGGWPTTALALLCCAGMWRDDCGDCGPVLESDFPYVAWNAPCGCPYPHPYSVDDWGSVNGYANVNNIKQAIYDYGPVSATVAVDSAFQAYDGGVFNACWNGTINHAIVLVGWDDNQGSEGVWILRNSWGIWWGEDGYMRIEYGCSKVGTNSAYVEYRYDCNQNGIPDDQDIAEGTSEDCNGNGVPDECDVARGTSNDCDGNVVPDECEYDFSGLTRLYVDPEATGAGDGTSWADALDDLLVARCLAQNEPGITEIWVVGGTYTPAAPGGSRSATFQLISGLALRGGFAGTETSLDQRDLSNPDNWSVLSGDLDGDDLPGFVNNGDNSYHVVTGEGVDATAVLDGFVITGGNADGPGPEGVGGGMYVYAGSPTVINCIVAGNFAAGSGAGMRVEWSLTEIGGSYPAITNCVFTGNHAAGSAGAISNLGTLFGPASPTLLNCSVVGNSGALVGGVYTEGNGAPTLVNCILWGNSSIFGSQDEMAQICGAIGIVNYCCIQGLTGDLGGTGNSGEPPLFVDADGADDIAGTSDDNLRLTFGSSCIDAGDNSSVPAGVTTDLDGNPRFVDDPAVPDSGYSLVGPPIVDRGAYEFQDVTCFGDLDGDDDIDLSDLSALLANYGTTSGATYADGDLDGDGAVGLSDLSAMLGVYGTPCP